LELFFVYSHKSVTIRKIKGQTQGTILPTNIHVWIHNGKIHLPMQIHSQHFDINFEENKAHFYLSNSMSNKLVKQYVLHITNTTITVNPKLFTSILFFMNAVSNLNSTYNNNIELRAERQLGHD
jgi:hypothetical protein